MQHRAHFQMPVLSTFPRRKPVGPLVLGGLALLIVLLPDTGYAITFPTIPGVNGNDDPVTIIIKLAALILKAVVYIIFAASFAVAAYVAITTLLKMVKDRDNAGDLVGKLMASVVVVVVCYWFLAEGEKASDALKNVNISAVIATPLATV